MSQAKHNHGKQHPRVRTLKVYDKIFIRARFLGCRYPVVFPEIRLIGKWLEDCGFEPGQHIDVITERNRLIIIHSWPDNEGKEIS